MSQLEENRMKHLKQVKKAAVALTVWMSCSFTVLATQHHSWLEATKGDSWDHWLSEFNQIEEQRLGPLALTPGVDEQQLNFAWYSSIETVGQPKVKVSLNEKMSDALEFSGDATTTPSGYLSNKVIITGLKPYQTYYYVYGSEDRWSEVYRYQTQGTEAFSFIVVSDPQIGASSKQIGNSHITDFLTFQCRKIFVRGLVLDCRIGAYEHEKHRTQKVTFECDVWIPLQDSTSSCDELQDVLNYDLIVGTISDIAQSAHFNLQETLVDAIADKLATLPGVQLLRVSSAKTEAYEHVDAVGIEVWRRRPSLS